MTTQFDIWTLGETYINSAAHTFGPDVEQEIRDAIRFHIEGLEADGIAVPQPTSIAEYVET